VLSIGIGRTRCTLPAIKLLRCGFSPPKFSLLLLGWCRYGYRWLRPRDNMTVAHYMEHATPIRRQLLGASSGGLGYTSPSAADVPLRRWLLGCMDAEAVRRCTERFVPLTTSAARL
jgi:hypothetical protein